MFGPSPMVVLGVPTYIVILADWLSSVMERTVIDWVEELRGLEPLQAAEAILSELGRTTRQRDLRTIAYALTAWAMLAKEEERRVQ